MPFTIIDDNAKLPTEAVLEKACNYPRRNRSMGFGSPSSSTFPLTPVTTKSKITTCRWDPIPVNMNSPKMLAKSNVSLNDCAGTSLRMPRRYADDDSTTNTQVHHQPLKLPTRTNEIYKDTVTMLELALSEIDLEHFRDESSAGSRNDHSSQSAATI
jgi:hypothetical protein